MKLSVRTAVAALTLAALAMAGCKSSSPLLLPQTPGQALYTIEGALTASINLAAKYKALPRCSTAGASLCSDPAVVSRMLSAAQAASSAVLDAELILHDAAAPPTAQQAAVQTAADALKILTDLTGQVRTS